MKYIRIDNTLYQDNPERVLHLVCASINGAKRVSRALQVEGNQVRVEKKQKRKVKILEPKETVKGVNRALR